MNLLYTLTSYPPSIGGAQIHQHKIACYLQSKLHHQVQVISHWDSSRSDWLLGTTIFSPTSKQRYKIDSISVHRINFSIFERLTLIPLVALYYPFMRFSVSQISTYLEKRLSPYAKKADIVHNVRIGREGISYASLKIARKFDIPFILTPVHHPRWSGWRYKIFNKIYKEADTIIALTPSEKRTLINLGVNEENICVTGLGPIISDRAFPALFREKYKLHSSKTVLFLGQHYKYKGYQQLLKAAPLVWSKHPDTKFIFVGPAVGNSEEFFRENQDPRIHRLGTVDLQTKTNALAACDVLCVPSSQESFGGIYLESWAFGKPVIGCRIPAVSDVVSDGKDGYLVAQNSCEIADRISFTLANPTRASQMGKAGRHKMESKYTWDKIALMTEHIYYQTLKV